MSTERAAELSSGLLAGLAGGAGLLASMQIGEWAEWIERIGLPAAMLLGLIYLLFRGARYLASTVIEPVTARHMSFVAKVEEAVLKGADAQARTAALVAELKQEAREDRKTTRIGFDNLRSAILRATNHNMATGANGRIVEEDDGEHDA